MKRRDFLMRGAGLGAATLAFGPRHLFGSFQPTTEKTVDLAVVKNGTPAAMVQSAMQALGGMSRFVSRGDIVVVKPNIGWDRAPEQAADTNPEVVAETIRLCYQAGAKKVAVFDRTCNDPRRCYTRSGIEEAVKKAGGEIRHIVDARFQKVAIPRGKALKSWEFYKDALECDTFINVPIAKHHGLSRLTLSAKNIMGIIGGNRGEIHNGIDQKLADLWTIIHPKLTIMDATRILVANGPQGGNLADVRQTNMIIAGSDMVAVDAYTTSLFELKANDIGSITRCFEMGLGQMDLSKVRIKEMNLG